MMVGDRSAAPTQGSSSEERQLKKQKHARVSQLD